MNDDLGKDAAQDDGYDYPEPDHKRDWVLYVLGVGAAAYLIYIGLLIFH